MRIAYLILAHTDIELVKQQITRLINDDSVIFIHFDKKLKIDSLDNIFYQQNVIILKKRLTINWGGFNIVNATIELLKEAYYHSLNFEQFILLSGQCFPIKGNDYINNFYKTDGRSIIEMNPLPYEQLKEGGLDKILYWYPFDLLHFININYKKLIFRYFKSFCKLFGLKRAINEKIKYCFGSQWWSLNRESVDYIITYLNNSKKELNFFKYTWAPDELFFQTILYNSHLQNKIKNESFRYLEWSKQGPPKILTLSDSDKLQKSEFLFARKFHSKESADIIKMF